MTSYILSKTGNTQFDQEVIYFAKQYQLNAQQAEATGNFTTLYRYIDSLYIYLSNHHIDANGNFTYNNLPNTATNEQKAIAMASFLNDILPKILDTNALLKNGGVKDVDSLVNTVNTYMSKYNDLIDDSVRFEAGQTAHINVFANDVDYTTLKTSAPKLIDPVTHQPAVNNTVVVKGEGTWTVDTAHPDQVVFTPEAGFTKSPTPIQYVTETKTGTKALVPATITVNYNSPDEAVGSSGMPVTVHVTANDTGITATTAIKLLDPTTHQTVDKIDVAEGTWSTGPNLGDITFTPKSMNSAEPAPIDYVTLDKNGHAILDSATSVAVHYPVPTNTQPIVSLTGLTDVNEAVGYVEYTLTLDKVNNVDTQVSLKLTDGKATQGTDYFALVDGNQTVANELNVTIPAGQKTATVYANVFDDTVYEGNENYALSIDRVENAIVNVTKSQVTTIIHDDATGATDGRDPNNPANHYYNDLSQPMTDLWINYPGKVPPATHDDNHAPVAHDDYASVDAFMDGWIGSFYYPTESDYANSGYQPVYVYDGVLSSFGNGGGYITTVADTDLDNDWLSVVGVRAGTESEPGVPMNTNSTAKGIYGTLSIRADGGFSYRVDESSKDYIELGEYESGSDVFTYTISDGHGGTDTAQMTISVQGKDDLPDINVVQSTVEEGKSIILTPPTGTDPDEGEVEVVGIAGQPLTLGVAQQILLEHGVLDVATDGTITFTADKGYNGPTEIIYQFRSGWNTYDLTGNYVTITGSNDVPIAAQDNYITHENTSFIFDPLANDIDADATNKLTLTHINDVLLTPGSTQQIIVNNGSVNITTDGKLTFVPATGFKGNTSFTYTIDDGNGGTAIGTENITVNNSLEMNVNSAPIAVNLEDSTIQGGVATTYNYFEKEYDRTILSSAKDANGDTLSVIGIRTGTEDGTGTNTGNQYGVEGTYGHLDLKVDGKYEYIADKAHLQPNEIVKDIFTYTISDGKGGTDSAELVFNVFSGYETSYQTNHTPVANSDSATLEYNSNGWYLAAYENQGVLNDYTFSVDKAYSLHSVKDTDADGNTLTVTGIRTGAENATGTEGTIEQGLVGNYGTLTMSADGEYSYQGNDSKIAGLVEGQIVQDTFTYTVSDGKGGIDTAELTIDVKGINDAPQFDAPTNVTVDAGKSLILDPLKSASDPDGDKVTLTQINYHDITPGVAQSITTSSGVVNVAVDGTITFVANPSTAPINSELLNFTFSDGKGGSSNYNEFISIAPTPATPVIVNGNHAPVANGDSAEMSLDFHKLEVNAANGVLHDAANGNFDLYTISNYSQADTDSDGDTLSVVGIRTGFEDQMGTNGTVGTPLKGYYGTLLINADGSYSYDTTGNQSGIELKNGQYTRDEFTYTVSDGKGATGTASLVINLFGTNDTPIANDDNYTVVQGNSVVLNPLANDIDPEREELTLFSINGEYVLPGQLESSINVEHGVVNVLANGTITFTPEDGYVGTTSFSYQIHDQDEFVGGGLFASATETIIVTEANVASSLAIEYKTNDVTANADLYHSDLYNNVLQVNANQNQII